LSFSAAGGEIFNQCVADNDEAFTEKDVIRLARQILMGVACLHQNNVVHLDLKVSVGHVCVLLVDHKDATDNFLTNFRTVLLSLTWSKT